MTRSKKRSKKVKGKSASKAISADQRATFGTSSFPKLVTGRFPGIGFPDRLRCHLKYCQIITMTVAASMYQVFNANSLFDPDNTGTGHQPTYFDQLSAVYKKYLVVGVQMTVEIINHDSGIGIFGVAVYSDNDNSGLTAEALAEGRFTKTFRASLSTGGPGTAICRMPYIKIPQIMGEPQIEPDPNMYSNVTGSPTDLAYAYWKLSADDLVGPIHGTTRTTLIYDCIFKDLTDPGQSLVEQQMLEMKEEVVAQTQLDHQLKEEYVQISPMKQEAKPVVRQSSNRSFNH